MGWSGRNAGQGAASGAATGSAFGPWGTVIGGVVGGIAGGLSGGGGGSAPPPTALPGPDPLGAFQSDLGGQWRDQLTGQINQANWNFDPSTMGSQLDAELMWNSYMGRDNTSQLNDLDWQIKSLMQNLERLRSQGTRAETVLPADFQGLQKFLDDGGELAEWARDPDGIKQGKYGAKGKQIYDEFMTQTQGSYGSGGFNAWLKDHVNRNVIPKVAEYKKFQATQMGNEDTSGRAMEDLQNQIQYLQQQRDRVANYQGSENPLERFGSDIGGRWQGGDNTNPWADEWAGVVGDKIAGIGQDPMDDMKRFGIGGEGDYSSQIQALVDKAGNIERIDPDRLQAPALDLEQAQRLKDSMNWQSANEFAAQRQQRADEAARRGMLNSSVLDMASAADRSQLLGSQKDAALKAAMLGTQLRDTNFGQQAQAANYYSNAIQGNNAANLAARGFQLSGLNQLEGNAARNYGLYLQGRDQAFGQAQNALQTANQMRDTDRARDVQDYGFGRDENATEYARANDMWNRLNAMRQQNFGNQLNQSNALAGQAQGAAGLNLNYAQMGTNQAVANQQMQNAYNMQQAQNEAARQQAMWQGLSNIAGAGMNAYGMYQANKPKTGTTPSATGVQNTNDWMQRMGG